MSCVINVCCWISHSISLAVVDHMEFINCCFGFSVEKGSQPHVDYSLRLSLKKSGLTHGTTKVQWMGEKTAYNSYRCFWVCIMLWWLDKDWKTNKRRRFGFCKHGYLSLRPPLENDVSHKDSTYLLLSQSMIGFAKGKGWVWIFVHWDPIANRYAVSSTRIEWIRC